MLDAQVLDYIKVDDFQGTESLQGNETRARVVEALKITSHTLQANRSKEGTIVTVKDLINLPREVGSPLNGSGRSAMVFGVAVTHTSCISVSMPCLPSAPLLGKHILQCAQDVEVSSAPILAEIGSSINFSLPGIGQTVVCAHAELPDAVHQLRAGAGAGAEGLPQRSPAAGGPCSALRL